MPRPAPDQIATDEQKQTAGLIAARGQGFREQPEAYLSRVKVDRRLLPLMGYTPETFDFAAMQVAHGDQSPVTGLGMGKVQGMFKSAVKARAAQYWMDQGLSYKEAQAAIAEFGGMKAGARTLANADARITRALTTAAATVEPVRALSAKINRTNYSDLNQLYLIAKERTGDPDVKRFITAIETLKNNYASAMGQGNTVMTQHMQLQADKLIDKAFSDGQIQAVTDQMMIEMNRELAGTKRAMGIFLGTTPPTVTPGGTGAGAGAGAGASGGGPRQSPRVRQGGHTFELQPDGSYKFIE
jgi:hypothetical protein